MNVLVTGSSGFIGSRVASALIAAGHVPLLTSRIGAAGTTALDLTDALSIERALRSSRPDAVIHAAAIRDLAQCEREAELARVVNLDASQCIANLCHEWGIDLVFVSTDQVFDGVAGRYCESSPVNPVNVYGDTKARAEEFVLANGRRVARVALTLGHSMEGDRSPNEHVVNCLRSGRPCTLYANEFRSPILVDDVASALVEMLSLDAPIVHLAGPDRVNRVELGLEVARAFGLDTNLCVAAQYLATEGALRRAADTSLDTTLARRMLKSPPRGLTGAVAELARNRPGLGR